MSFDNTGIIFLEDMDFDDKTLTHKGKPLKDLVLVMVQGSYCHFCKEAKPDFVEAKKRSNGKCVFATIQIDGDKSEQNLSKKLSSIVGKQLGGIPAYLVFKNGHFKEVYQGGRDVNSICNYLKMMS